MYNDYYNDFYSPSEFDIMILELKDELRKSVKEEYLNIIKKLEDEIAEFEEFRNNKAIYERDLASVQAKVETIKNEAYREASRKRLDELLADVNVPAWKISSKYEYTQPKCDRCDDNRQIHFTSPSGKDMTEPCECSIRKYRYFPEEVRCIEFHTQNKECCEKVFVTFIQTREELNGWNGHTGRWERAEYGDNYAYILYKDEPFEKAKNLKHNFYFLCKEKCQEFCDWLNGEQDKC